MRIYSVILICWVILISGCGIFSTKPVEKLSPPEGVNPLEQLRSDIDEVLQDSLFRTASVGIKVVSVETGEVIYVKNAHKLHHPASTTKLFTAATALAKLGSNFQFETTLHVVKTFDPHVIGNLYLKGSGDPLLDSADIVALCNTLLESGLKSIEGNIVVDETYFDTVREGPGWMWDDKPFHVSSLSIRDLEPDVKTGSRAIACGNLLKTTLIQKGMTVSGDVIAGPVPSDAQIVTTHLSPFLSEIIRLMNKPSDNWIAEFLFKSIGAVVKGEPGTWRKGRDSITDFLGEIFDEPPAHRFVDGSGLSRYNLLNVELLTNLLVYMYNNFELMPEFTASLPIAGVDGTLKNRMQGMYAEKVLRAKTGTLSGVSALAGYTRTADGEVFAFGILISHYVGSAAVARGIQDKIGDVLTQFSRHAANKR